VQVLGESVVGAVLLHHTGRSVATFALAVVARVRMLAEAARKGEDMSIRYIDLHPELCAPRPLSLGRVADCVPPPTFTVWTWTRPAWWHFVARRRWSRQTHDAVKNNHIAWEMTSVPIRPGPYWSRAGEHTKGEWLRLLRERRDA